MGHSWAAAGTTGIWVPEGRTALGPAVAAAVSSSFWRESCLSLSAACECSANKDDGVSPLPGGGVSKGEDRDASTLWCDYRRGIRHRLGIDGPRLWNALSFGTGANRPERSRHASLVPNGPAIGVHPRVLDDHGVDWSGHCLFGSGVPPPSPPPRAV